MPVDMFSAFIDSKNNEGPSKTGRAIFFNNAAVDADEYRL